MASSFFPWGRFAAGALPRQIASRYFLNCFCLRGHLVEKTVTFSRAGLHTTTDRLGSSRRVFQHGPQQRPLRFKWQQSVIFQRSGLTQIARRGQKDTGAKVANTKATHTVVEKSKLVETTAAIESQYRTIENALRYRGYNTLRIIIGCAGVVGILVYINASYLRQNISDEVAGVARRSLADEDFVHQADDLSKALIRSVLNDKNINEYAMGFLSDLMSKPGTRDAVVKLLAQVVNEQYTLDQLAKLAGTLVNRLIADPTTMDGLLRLLVQLLSHPDTYDSAKGLLNKVFVDPELNKSASAFLGSVLASKDVLEKATGLTTKVVHKVLSDASVQEHATLFLQTTLSDGALHKKGGTAIWEAVKYTVTPSFIANRWTPSDGEEEGDEEGTEIVEGKEAPEVVATGSIHHEQTTRVVIKHGEGQADDVQETTDTVNEDFVVEMGKDHLHASEHTPGAKPPVEVPKVDFTVKVLGDDASHTSKDYIVKFKVPSHVHGADPLYAGKPLDERQDQDQKQGRGKGERQDQDQKQGQGKGERQDQGHDSEQLDGDKLLKEHESIG